LKILDICLLGRHYHDHAVGLLEKQSAIEEVSLITNSFSKLPIQANEVLVRMRDRQQKCEALLLEKQGLIDRVLNNQLAKDELDALQEFVTQLKRLGMTFKRLPTVESYIANFESMGKLDKIAGSSKEFTIGETKGALESCSEFCSQKVVAQVNDMLDRCEAW
jgi:hypothetical protein